MCSVRAQIYMGFDHSFVRVAHTVRLQLQPQWRLIQVERLRDVADPTTTKLKSCSKYAILNKKCV